VFVDHFTLFITQLSYFHSMWVF